MTKEGRYPELDYTGMDYHEISWIDHIVINLESDRGDTWHGVSLRGTLSCMSFNEKDKERVENIKKRLPNLRIVITQPMHSHFGGGGVYWVKDADAHARLVQILLKEREAALFYAKTIDVALGLELPKKGEGKDGT